MQGLCRKASSNVSDLYVLAPQSATTGVTVQSSRRKKLPAEPRDAEP